jgi:hypothetical protein
MTHCPACGSETPEGARFCQNCGADLLSATRPEVAEAMPGGAVTAPRIAPPTFPPAAPPYATQPSMPYPPPPYAVVPGQPYLPTRSGKAVAGFWLGIASIFPGTLLSWVGIVIGVLGLVFSLIGVRETRVAVANRWQAVTGAILSVIGIAASSAFLIYILTHLDDFGIKLTR